MSENRGGLLTAAIGGGVIGAALMAVLLVFAGRTAVGDTIVRGALSRHPEILVETADLLRDRQYAPTIAANKLALETPFASSWKGAARPEVQVAALAIGAVGLRAQVVTHHGHVAAKAHRAHVVVHPAAGPAASAALAVATGA